MMEPSMRRPRYPLVIARQVQGTLIAPLRAGDAFEDDGFYAVKLAAFPFRYFLRKNKDADSDYTLFARMIQNGNEIKFQDPIGRAWLDEQLKTHLIIEIPILRMQVFMSLYPNP